MIHVRPLSAEEQTELTRMTRQEVGRVSHRAQMILWSAQSRSVPEIAALFTVSRPTVRFWIRQFQARGPAGLYEAPRCGRPRKIAPPLEARRGQIVTRDP